jgi:hypothetical protein
VVANYDTLLRYDDSWQLLDGFSHPLFVGMHEIDWDGEHLWTTATAIDAVVRTDLDGMAEVAWDPHSRELASRFKLRPREHPVDGSVDYRQRQAPLLDDCHINCVSHYAGQMVVNCGLVQPRQALGSRLLGRMRGSRRSESAASPARRATLSAVVRVNGNGADDVLAQLDGVDFPTHNGQLLDPGRIVVNDSTRNTLRVVEVDSGRELQSLKVPGTWLRGLEPVDPSHLFVGTAPASIVLIDLEAAAIEAELRLSDDPNEAIHGLTAVPEPDERV